MADGAVIPAPPAHTRLAAAVEPTAPVIVLGPAAVTHAPDAR